MSKECKTLFKEAPEEPGKYDARGADLFRDELATCRLDVRRTRETVGLAAEAQARAGDSSAKAWAVLEEERKDPWQFETKRKEMETELTQARKTVAEAIAGVAELEWRLHREREYHGNVVGKHSRLKEKVDLLMNDNERRQADGQRHSNPLESMAVSRTEYKELSENMEKENATLRLKLAVDNALGSPTGGQPGPSLSRGGVPSSPGGYANGGYANGGSNGYSGTSNQQVGLRQWSRNGEQTRDV